MIKIERVRIVKFRGILDLTIEIGCKNFVICGPNGTGKSGVVDAVEFALSGDISRLSGKGRGSVSVKEHAPHVDYRSRPDDAFVRLEGVVQCTGETFSITRSVGDPKNPNIKPRSATIDETLEQLSQNKSPTLSRRELIQFVLSTPGDRAEEIQALLQLNFLRETGKTLQKISNGCARDLKTMQGERSDASRQLATAVGIPVLKSTEVLEKANEKRAALGLPGIPKLEANTSVKDGLTVASEKAESALSKPIASADISSFDGSLKKFTGTEASSKQLVAKLTTLKGGGNFDIGVDRKELLDRALKLIDEGKCPVCDTDWDPEELTRLVSGKLVDLEGVLKEKSNIETSLAPIGATCSSLASIIGNIITIGKKLKPETKTENLAAFSDFLNRASIEISQFDKIDSILPLLEKLHDHDDSYLKELEVIRERVGVLPDTSERDAARDYLVELDVRLGAFREAKRKEQKAEIDAVTAKKVFETFRQTYSDILTAMYGEIQTEFADLYREINKEDEAGFEALLPIEKSGVGLDVDFYGRGKFPPGAYHSEGHQDGMGLCLYLALMRHLYGGNFHFCVLDDVLMSVDSGHRRSVCSMLLERFPDTQFMFTTHDEVWLKNMGSTGLVKTGAQLHFRNWSVEGGPSEWISEDIWHEIDDLVAKNDIPGASAKLRHYFEYLSSELCHGLGATVVFRGDSRYTLGQLLPNATSQLAKLYKAGRLAADSWKDKELSEKLAKTENEFKDLVNDQKLEEWGVNATLHFNSWATLSKEDFQPIANAFMKIDEAVRCEKCKGLLYLTPSFGPKEMLKCDCAYVSVNLKKKPTGSN